MIFNSTLKLYKTDVQIKMNIEPFLEKIALLKEENRKLNMILELERLEHRQELRDQANRFEQDKIRIIDKFDQEISSMFKELQSVHENR